MADDVRDFNELVLAFARASGPLRRRLAARMRAPGGEKIRGAVKQFAGLEAVLAAFDSLGQRPDPDKTTVYDRIRQQAAQKQQPTAEGPSLDERLRRR